MDVVFAAGDDEIVGRRQIEAHRQRMRLDHEQHIGVFGNDGRQTGGEIGIRLPAIDKVSDRHIVVELHRDEHELSACSRFGVPRCGGFIPVLLLERLITATQLFGIGRGLFEFGRAEVLHRERLRRKAFDP